MDLDREIQNLSAEDQPHFKNAVVMYDAHCAQYVVTSATNPEKFFVVNKPLGPMLPHVYPKTDLVIWPFIAALACLALSQIAAPLMQAIYGT